MDEADWKRLIDQLRRGDCTPFLGAGACGDTLPTGTELSRRYATRYGYPFTDHHDLARVMQYAEAEVRDPVDLKVEVCQELQAHGRPPVDDPGNTYALLAQFPLSVFLTTNYDDFLTDALRRAGKQPHVAVAPWWSLDLAGSPDIPAPTVDRPIVYHLHGSWGDPRSLVLTEVDYLTYLLNLVDASALGSAHPLPTPVLDAMISRPLLFIGYSLQDWTFRVLFRGLARTVPRSTQRRHVSVQLLPEIDGSADGAEEKARRYITRYLHEWNISIFLGSASQFCDEFRRRMGGTS